MPGMTDITVLKRNLAGEVTWQYEGRVLKRGSSCVILEAFFNRDDMPFMEVVFKRGDRFVETFYSDRWYNVFEIHDRDDGSFKGWYCNVGYPAVIERDTVSYIDLALDLWVSANGAQTVLDEDEFLGLSMDVMTRAQAVTALDQLKQKLANKKPPA
jgi:protein associated with RNAse G/E